MKSLKNLCGPVLAAFVLCVLSSAAQSVHAQVVISQVYGGAGCGTANCSTYKNDYIELFNRGTSSVNLSGWSVQYAAATGTSWQVTPLTSFTLKPGQYYLVAESSSANGVSSVPTPDTTGTIAMSATAGKVALVNTTAALSGSCPAGAQIVDLVGYGSTASCFEGAGPAPAPSTTTADVRAGGGSVDTNNNNADFTASAPSPRNSTIVVAVAGGLLISEFRLRGPNGANDEFIEIYNNTDAPHTVNATDGSAGYAVAAQDNTIRFTIPNGTVIPVRGHYLGVNSVGYSLAAYPAGNGTTATGDATYTTDIPDNSGIAIFRSSTTFDATTRLDSVGFTTTPAGSLFVEGTGLPTLLAFSVDYSFYRDMRVSTGGKPKDTNDNAADFLFVDTNGTSAGAGQRLGAPGPENLSSPIERNSLLPMSLLDPSVPAASPPNRVRDTTSDSANNSTFGTLSIRRTVTNNTGANITRIRFRIVDITTFPAPSGTADLRARTSPIAVVVTVAGANPGCPGTGPRPCTVQPTTLEEPPAQPNGGAFNSTLSAGTISLATPVPPGGAINVQFLLGLQQTGAFRFLVNVEALP